MLQYVFRYVLGVHVLHTFDMSWETSGLFGRDQNPENQRLAGRQAPAMGDMKEKRYYHGRGCEYRLCRMDFVEVLPGYLVPICTRCLRGYEIVSVDVQDEGLCVDGATSLRGGWEK